MTVDALETTVVQENPALTALRNSQRVLLLQGPIGPFFDRLTRWLQAHRKEVVRVAFQGGDLHDATIGETVTFNQSFGGWAPFLAELLTARAVDVIVLFGQSRPFHQVAIEMAKARGVAMVVMEEGYFRPGFATLELGGVNGYSTTMQLYQWRSFSNPEEAASQRRLCQPDITQWHFQKMCWHATRHYLALAWGRQKFSQYIHHRGDKPLHYAAFWLRSWWRKSLRYLPDRQFQKRLQASSRQYFLVPLQHDGDAQITHHSPFQENTEFILRVMRSFFEHAPDDAWLVFRQHPHSRGGKGHRQFVMSFAHELGLAHRVHYLVESETPALAQHAAGVVVINSTVGLQTLERGAPLIVLGEAIYDRPGLTFQGELGDFWIQAQPGDRHAVEDFLQQLRALTQVPVSLYAFGDEPLRWDPLK